MILETFTDWWCLVLICMTCFLGSIELIKLVVEFAFWVSCKMTGKEYTDEGEA